MPAKPNARELLLVSPLLDQRAAKKKLALRSYLPPFRKVRFEKIELCRLPHYLFEIRVQWKDVEETAPVAIDAVAGHFAVWRPDQPSFESAEDMEFEIPFMLGRDEARKKLQEQYRWVLISTGLKMRKRFEVKEVIDGPRIYYPFWVGYHKIRGQWRFEVVDAVSGMRQGGKVKDALMAGWVGEA